MSPAVNRLLYCVVVLRLAGEAVCVLVVRFSMPDAELMEVLKQPVEIRNPQDQDHDDQAV